MKKLNITSQLILLFFMVLLIASSSFTIITISFISDIAEKEVYSRLSTYVYLVNNQNIINNPNTHDFPDMEVGYYIKNTNNEFISENINTYISNENLSLLLEEITINNQKLAIRRGSFESKQSKIYYVFLDNNDSQTIIFTDDTFSSELVKDVVLKTNVIFFLIILLSIFVIMYWSNGFTRRIRRIQHHLANLPKNKYEKKLYDDSYDEIGELSNSIEKMRIEIYQNEKTKQEMLQNLSHDFKTPIAVIKSYAEAQVDGMADENASEVIINQAEILRKKVNRLLQYNSLEYLDKTKKFENISMNEIIDEVIEAYKYQISQEFEIDCKDNIFFRGYRENWYTVVDNIIDNAKRYAKSKIKIVLRQDRLRIYNDGNHIDEQFLNSVFKPYEKGSKGEFGLGMSIVKKTVNFFGYNLEVVNEEVGVSFIIKR